MIALYDNIKDKYGASYNLAHTFHPNILLSVGRLWDLRARNYYKKIG